MVGSWWREGGQSQGYRGREVSRDTRWTEPGVERMLDGWGTEDWDGASVTGRALAQGSHREQSHKFLLCSSAQPGLERWPGRRTSAPCEEAGTRLYPRFATWTPGAHHTPSIGILPGSVPSQRWPILSGALLGAAPVATRTCSASGVFPSRKSPIITSGRQTDLEGQGFCDLKPLLAPRIPAKCALGRFQGTNAHPCG